MSESKQTYYVRVIEDTQTNRIVAAATLLVELKFLRNCGKCGHIEDVVVNSQVRGQNLGKMIIEDLMRIGNELGCYKIILDCNEKNIPFYEKCGFHKTEYMMRYPKK
jgi:glucosamine-phosphate N-acetyltransferase